MAQNGQRQEGIEKECNEGQGLERIVAPEKEK